MFIMFILTKAFGRGSLWCSIVVGRTLVDEGESVST